MPIFDYHCHLTAKEIAEDRRFSSITEVWLGEDHYKWRVLRANGVPEEYVTGAKSEKEKFLKWANVGVLSRFVGMLTDSRSLLSYTRHEYFRRILCNIIGKWVENGEYPANIERLGRMVKDISYNNIANYIDVDW
ncbi:glucuronate isomerase [Aquibacillus albus]|uniref:Uronate isomerase n=1 Tax=Aquibacillus albus TaxID=1168171 RepID=A0ABS2N3Q9_9BACI|nr:glucuronate isomerase [Aquibacillus albus]